MYPRVMRSRWVPMVGALVLAVAGCSGSGSDQPKVLPPVPSATVAVSPTPTATAAPVVVPSAAVPATPQGAAAFVRFFYGELNAAFQDGQGRRIRALSNPICAACNKFASDIDLGAGHGKKIIGTTFDALKIEASAQKNNFSSVTVLGTVPTRQRVVNGVITVLPASGPFQTTVTLQRRQGHWLVVEIRLERS